MLTRPQLYKSNSQSVIHKKETEFGRKIEQAKNEKGPFPRANHHHIQLIYHYDGVKQVSLVAGDR